MNDSLPILPTYKATLSSQGQITISAKIRKLAGLKPGATLSLLTKNLGDNLTAIIAYILPKDPIEKYYGVGKKIYRGWGGADKVIKEERDSWGTR